MENKYKMSGAVLVAILFILFTFIGAVLLMPVQWVVFGGAAAIVSIVLSLRE